MKTQLSNFCPQVSPHGESVSVQTVAQIIKLSLQTVALLIQTIQAPTTWESTTLELFSFNNLSRFLQQFSQFFCHHFKLLRHHIRSLTSKEWFLALLVQLLKAKKVWKICRQLTLGQRHTQNALNITPILTQTNISVLTTKKKVQISASVIKYKIKKCWKFDKSIFDSLISRAALWQFCLGKKNIW